MTPKRITLHHSLTEDSDTVSWGAIRAYHTRTLGWRDIGYHFGIELLRGHYEILMGRMPDDQGAHVAGHNTDNLGICFVGNFDNHPPPDEQLLLGVKLVQYLRTIYNIPLNEIYMHRHFNPHKSCPGHKFPFERFIALL